MIKGHTVKSRLKDAKIAGDTYYFTGKPCNKGHISRRLTSNGKCCICNNNASSEWARKNPEKAKRIANKHKENPLSKYTQHRNRAKRCGIPFKLSFEEWWRIWQESGKWESRGASKDGYVMSRCNDEGAYEVGNVFIQKHIMNARQGTNKVHSENPERNVTYDKATDSYRVSMIIDGNKYWLGRYKDKELATFVAQEAREKYSKINELVYYKLLERQQ